ncbi:MAG: 1-acyl-sn-glycerol-3-phosphate acyltransferase [Bacteroidales bacterium]|nr:1-acyl-sn-glycerol-3-phosphate acyltransferase [Bacteroidales bacterium]
MEKAKYETEGQDFKEVMRALVEHEMFAAIAMRLFPETPLGELKRQLMAMESVGEFQSTFMYRGCQWVIENSMTSFTYDGVENLGDRPNLFVSNHRDIVLDAMMLQYILVNEGRETSRVVIGANLFEIPIMPALARLNKMYSIGRGGNKREYYRSLLEMSQHLRKWVVERGESVWIAQRNGRTKDGIDHTEPALVKMIASSGKEKEPVGALQEMNITPVSVSYEWEPCAAMKARELCLSREGEYVKAPGEDMQSVFSGIKDFKGRVHFSIGKPLEAEEIAAAHGNHLTIAALIDRRIADGYKLWHNNYMAKEMLSGRKPEGEEGEVAAFEKYVEDACQQYPLGEEFRQRLLSIYANAVGK